MNGLGRTARGVKHGLKRLTLRCLPEPLLLRLLALKRPRSAQLEATTACNLHCPLCVTHDLPRGRSVLTRAAVLNVLRGAGSRLKSVSFHVMGEPLLNPELPAMIADCEARGVRTSFSTNGMLLDRHVDALLDARLTYLSVAVDGATPEDYACYRKGGELDTVVANTRALVAARDARGLDRPTVQAQMVMFSYNEDREAEARAFLEGIGADVVSFKRPSYAGRDTEAAHEFLELVDHADDTRRYARPASRPEKLYRNQRVCPQLEHPTVLSDGSLVACCLDAVGDTRYADLNRDDFAAAWRGPARRELLRRFLRKELPVCAHCTLAFHDEDSSPALGELA